MEKFCPLCLFLICHLTLVAICKCQFYSSDEEELHGQHLDTGLEHPQSQSQSRRSKKALCQQQSQSHKHSRSHPKKHTRKGESMPSDLDNKSVSSYTTTREDNCSQYSQVTTIRPHSACDNLIRKGLSKSRRGGRIKRVRRSAFSHRQVKTGPEDICPS